MNFLPIKLFPQALHGDAVSACISVNFERSEFWFTSWTSPTLHWKPQTSRSTPRLSEPWKDQINSVPSALSAPGWVASGAAYHRPPNSSQHFLHFLINTALCVRLVAVRSQMLYRSLHFGCLVMLFKVDCTNPNKCATSCTFQLCHLHPRWSTFSFPKKWIYAALFAQ